MVATRVTYATLGAARTIFSGSSRVSSILISNGGASNIVVTLRDIDNNIKLDLAVLAYSSASWDAEWIADNGLTVDAESSSVSVTVAHSSSGA